MGKDFTNNYLLLDRLRTDCDYYLGNGNRFAGQLWAKSEEEQIKKMCELYDSFPPNLKPEWLKLKDISRYADEMISKEDVLKEVKNIIGKIGAKEDIRSLDKLYKQVSNLEVSNGNIYIILDVMQDKINNEIVKLQKEYNISYKEYKQISELNDKEERDLENLKTLGEDRLNGLFETGDTQTIVETLNGLGFTNEEILEQFSEEGERLEAKMFMDNGYTFEFENDFNFEKMKEEYDSENDKFENIPDGKELAIMTNEDKTKEAFLVVYNQRLEIVFNFYNQKSEEMETYDSKYFYMNEIDSEEGLIEKMKDNLKSFENVYNKNEEENEESEEDSL